MENPRKRARAAAACLLAGLVSAAGAGCPALLEQARAAFSARDPTLFSLSPWKEGCDPGEAYAILYYQGFALAFSERLEDARLHFELALDIGGPRDAQILLALMRLHAASGDASREEQVFRRLEGDHPRSPYLDSARALRERRWRGEGEGTWFAGLGHAYGNLPYEGPKARAMADIGWRLRRAGWSAATRLNLQGRLPLDARKDGEFGAGVGVEVERKGVSFLWDGGPVFSRYPDSLASAPAEGRWEWRTSGRLEAEIQAGTRIRLRPSADLLAAPSYASGGGGLRVEWAAGPFVESMLERFRVRQCPADSGVCEENLYDALALGGGHAWRRKAETWTASGHWRYERLSSGARAREVQSAALRYFRRLTARLGLAARLEGGRKDIGSGWEPLLRGAADVAAVW